MEKQIFKRTLSGCIALLGSVVIAVTALAVPAVADSVRTVTVDTETVLSETFHGYGDNLWPGAYYYGMNDAYQIVNDQRNNTIKPAYVRMMFLPHWLVDLSQSEEQQQYNWENGIYYWDNEDYKGFVRNCKSIVAAGGKIQLNFGGRVPVEIASWYSIKNVFLTEGGTRSAPRNIDAFANACVAAIKELQRNGIPVDYLSFHNEVNGGNFEAFGDKRMYWCEVVRKTSLALDAEGLRSIELNKAGTRDGIYIDATELSGWADEPQIISFMEYAKEHLIDKGYADGLVTHLYRNSKDYDTVVELTNKLGELFPDEEILINEFSSKYVANGRVNEVSYNFKDDFASAVITQTNAGLNGGCDWFYYGQYIPYPTNTGQNDTQICVWEAPSSGHGQVSEKYALMGLAMRYIPKMSKSVKTECDSDDIIASAYTKGDDCTVFLSVDKADSARKLKVYVGDEFVGRDFGLHVYNAPIDSDGDGDQDCLIPYADADLLPVRIDELKVDTDGYITWDIPYGEDVRNMTVVMTTLEEQIQVQLENAELSVMPGGSVDINVKDVFGVDCNDFRFEIYDYSNVNDEKEDYERAFNETFTTVNVGSITETSGTSATFTADANLNVGDTIAIKVTPKTTMSPETEGYVIAIINVGQYRIYFNHGQYDPTVVYTSPVVNIGDTVKFTSLVSTSRSGYSDDYTFEGWYLEPDFSGEAITETNPAWNSTQYIYGKWTKKQ